MRRRLDLTVDGADEIGPNLGLIKGGGGALLREKIVAAASARMIVIADQSKCVAALGQFPLPIEVVSFGLMATQRALGRQSRRFSGLVRLHCVAAKTAMFLSRMAATGSSTQRLAGLTIRPHWRMRYPVSPALWSTDCFLALHSSPL